MTTMSPGEEKAEVQDVNAPATRRSAQAARRQSQGEIAQVARESMIRQSSSRVISHEPVQMARQSSDHVVAHETDDFTGESHAHSLSDEEKHDEGEDECESKPDRRLEHGPGFSHSSSMGENEHTAGPNPSGTRPWVNSLGVPKVKSSPYCIQFENRDLGLVVERDVAGTKLLVQKVNQAAPEYAQTWVSSWCCSLSLTSTLTLLVCCFFSSELNVIIRCGRAIAFSRSRTNSAPSPWTRNICKTKAVSISYSRKYKRR